MRAGSLCTGIGGLDLAVEAHFGADLAWCAEWETHLGPVLQRHFGPVLNLRDLTTVAWDELEPVDVLTAGYPCQPFSHAGKRKGKDDERHLWPYIAEAVRVLRPRWVVLENVAGHLTLGFGDVLRDLAEAGFDAEWCLLRASDVGACHNRARIFIVATDAVAAGPQGPQSAERHDMRAGCSGGSPPDASGQRHGTRQDGRGVGRLDSKDAGTPRQRQRTREELGDRGTTAAPDAQRIGLQGSDHPRGVQGLGAPGREPAGAHPAVAWGDYEPAIRRWERVLGRPAPRPTDAAGRLSPPFVEWMMGYPEGWVDGLTRTQALKALGNAVVPQQGLAALRELAPLEQEQAA